MSRLLTELLPRLSGMETAPGEGTRWTLDHRWGLSPSLTLLLAIVATAYVVGIYLREGRAAGTRLKLALAGLRLAAVAVLLLMIAQVGIAIERTGLPSLALLIDNSQSMGQIDPYEKSTQREWESRVAAAGLHELSRWNLARTLLTRQHGRLLGELAEHYKLRAYYLSPNSGATPAAGGTPKECCDELASLQPTVPVTPLGAAVRTILGELRGSPPAALLLVTDGNNTDGPTLADAAQLARRRGVPLFTIGLGDTRPARRLQIADLLVDPTVFVGDVVNFEFKLAGTGLEGRKAAVVLRVDGKPESLARIEVTLGPDGKPQPCRLPYRPATVGRFRYALEAGLVDEPGAENMARQVREVEVRKDKIRVLYVQGYPSYEYRYLRNMLARDDSIALNTVLQDADVGHAGQDPVARATFPVRREELFAFDVILLGDANPALLGETALANLAAFVEQKSKGGALVFLSGPKYMPLAYRHTPLAACMPVDLSSARVPDPESPLTEPFTVQPTELGLLCPAFQLGDSDAETQAIWRSLPPLYWMLEAPDTRPGARVLAEHPTRIGRNGRPLPLVVLQYVDAGRVLMHLTDETWRWRYRLGDTYFARYWVQMIRYLARSRLAGQGGDVRLATERREYAHGEPVPLRVRFADERQAPVADDGVTVVVEHPGRKTEHVPLARAALARGVFTGLFTPPGPGTYHAWIAAPAVEGRAPAIDFTVLPPAGEGEPLPMNAVALQHAAEESGGRFYTFATADRLPADLPAGRQLPVESLPPKPLWNRWPVLLLFVLLLSGEWLLRKRAGMV